MPKRNPCDFLGRETSGYFGVVSKPMKNMLSNKLNILGVGYVSFSDFYSECYGSDLAKHGGLVKTVQSLKKVLFVFHFC